VPTLQWHGDRPPARRHAGVCETLVDLLMVAICLFVMAWYGTKLCMETMGPEYWPTCPGCRWGSRICPCLWAEFSDALFVLERLAFGTQHHRAVVRFDHEAGEVSAEAV
jgi:TRAP-type C4-dicarboxylate transport system permease small subunit